MHAVKMQTYFLWITYELPITHRYSQINPISTESWAKREWNLETKPVEGLG